MNFIGSIIPNTNKIISESNADWSGIRPGSLVKFKSDKVIYQAVNVEPVFYIQDFDSLDEQNILIKNNTGAHIAVGDELTLSYKEYELLTVFDIIDGGNGYAVDDILFLEGGEPVVSVEDGQSVTALLRVSEVRPGGIITRVSIERKGLYIETPEKSVTLKGGRGKAARINVGFKLKDARAILERDVAKIEIGNETKIKLSYKIPKAIKDGKISIKKNILTLNANYSGPNQHCKQFDVARDYTINYKWPLVVDNSFSIHDVFNQVVSAQDAKIKDLEERLNKLEGK